jgi:hypothetical protein
VAVPAGDETAFTDTATASTVLVNDAKVGSDGERSKLVNPVRLPEFEALPQPEDVAEAENETDPSSPFALWETHTSWFAITLFDEGEL